MFPDVHQDVVCLQAAFYFVLNDLSIVELKSLCKYNLGGFTYRSFLVIL